jgi:hypothetical protein
MVTFAASAVILIPSPFSDLSQNKIDQRLLIAALALP